MRTIARNDTWHNHYLSRRKVKKDDERIQGGESLFYCKIAVAEEPTDSLTKNTTKLTHTIMLRDF